MGILQLIVWYKFGQNQARRSPILDMLAHAQIPTPNPLTQKHN